MLVQELNRWLCWRHLAVILPIPGNMQRINSSRPFRWPAQTISIAAVLFLAVPLAAQETKKAREIAAEVRPAVVSVRALLDGEPVSAGSGFLIRDDGVIVTNLHVVEEASSLEVELESGEIYDNVYVLGVDERRDLILLQIPATNLPVATVEDDRHLRVGDPVYVMGNPMGLSHTFSDGLLSARRPEGGVAYLQISAPISQGSSGGPVLNERGAVVGVATLTVTEGQNLNLAVPARHADGILALASDPEPFAEMAVRTSREADPSGPELPRDVVAFADSMGLDRESREDLAEMEPWERSVAVQSMALVRVASQNGWTLLDERKFGYLDEGEVDVVPVRLDPGSYKAVAVCDDDCDDIDLMILDPGNEELGRDFLVDAFPVVDFSASQRGVYSIGTSMVDCSTEICYFGVLVFRR